MFEEVEIGGQKGEFGSTIRRGTMVDRMVFEIDIEARHAPASIPALFKAARIPADRIVDT